jgi:hypothetical protein
MSDTPNNPTPEKDWKTVFLAALAASPNVAKAARAAGVNRSYTYEARKADAEFASRWDDVMEESLDDLEASALDRAKDDTTLTIFILKNRRRETYGERVSTEHSGGITLTHEQALAELDGPDDASGTTDEAPASG